MEKRGTYCEANAMYTRAVGRKTLPEESVAPPTSESDPSSASLVSLKEAMSKLYLCYSTATNAVRSAGAGLSEASVSSNVRTFQVANR